MEKLPVEFKEKWVAALRSGKYKQGSDYLKNGDRYCCLGVACVISDVPINPKQRFIENGEGIPDILKGTDALPYELSRMNDGNQLSNPHRMSFAKIADYIENNL